MTLLKSRWSLMIVRVILGLVYVYASIDKILHPRLFADAVAGFGLVPPKLVTLVAVILPWLELIAGGLLVVGLLACSSALVLGFLSLIFGGAISFAIIQGLDITCGCFALGSGVPGWGHLALNALLLALSAITVCHGPGPVSLDRSVFGERCLEVFNNETSLKAADV